MPEISTIAGWIGSAESVVAFTGAGISTESGIPDFRSPGGIWSQSQPVYYDDFMAGADARYEYWRQKCIAHRDFADAQPNAGHEVLARWEARGVLEGLITQNIDGLHQLAGSARVLELHGTARMIACQDCGARFDVEPLVAQFLEQHIVPQCTECTDGRLKHATISFGQSMPQQVMQESTALAAAANVFLAMGSSLVVEPAASLPRLAKQSGARLIIINRDETPQDHLADAVLRASIGVTLTRIDSALAAE